jgi:hypothetical protein
MFTFSEQFEEALKRIQPNAARAQSAHAEVTSVLEGSSTLQRWGLSPVLIGSYARGTSIYPGKDADIFARLTALDTSVSPKEIFERTCKLLVEHYGERAQPQNRSIKITFEKESNVNPGFAVDVVPAVKADAVWAIPRRDRKLWEEDDARWRLTNPERLTELTQQQNRLPQISGRGAYVPVVKLVRQIRKHWLDKDKPGGLYIELCTYWAFQEGVSGDSYAELLTDVLDKVGSRLSNAVASPLLDPAMGNPYSPAPRPDDLLRASACFKRLAADAHNALREDKCPAAVLWRSIIGKNRRGYCFVLPGGCDEQGRPTRAVRIGQSAGPDEARSFA